MCSLLQSSPELVRELLIGSYVLPAPQDPGSSLARREARLFASMRAILAASDDVKSTASWRRVLPLCRPAAEAMGHRMAYDAAVVAGVRPCLVDLFVANVLRLDSERGGSADARAAEAEDAVLPLLGELVGEMDVLDYVCAPIASDEAWEEFVGGLRVFRGDAQADVLRFGMAVGANTNVRVEGLRSRL